MGELIDKMKGTAKQIEGDLTGDPLKKTEGVVDVAKGRVKGAFEEVKQAVKQGARDNQHGNAKPL